MIVNIVTSEPFKEENLGKCTHSRLVAVCPALFLAMLAVNRPAQASAVTGTQAPYFSSANSPLVTASPGYHLENFESGTLAVAGVTLTTAHGSSIDPGTSVDGDDGSIDGSGAAGKSLTVFTQGGTNGATFTFNSVTLGGLPKSVGIAVTAAIESPMVLTIFDPSNAVSGTLTIPSVSTSTPTSDDFLIWGSDPAGISAFSVSSNNAAIHMHLDHLQFDMNNAIPEPASLGLLGMGMLGLLARRRRL